MMGVYINMEKPKECGDCNFVQAFWDDKRWLFRCLVTDKIAEDCPLIEMVTCGECKHCEKRETANHIPFYYCLSDGISVKDTDYCSWGEREGER